MIFPFFGHNTHTPCHNIVPDSHPSSIAEVEMPTAGTRELSPVVVCCDNVTHSFSINGIKIFEEGGGRGPRKLQDGPDLKL